MSGPTPSSGSQRSRRERALIAALVVLVVLITLFAVLNVEEVEVDWIFGKVRTPLIVVIAVSLLVGGLLTHFAQLRNRHRQR